MKIQVSDIDSLWHVTGEDDFGFGDLLSIKY
jgi:hypothetical protein